MNLSDLLIIGLAVFYWSYVLTKADGPFHLFASIRDYKGGWFHGRRTWVITSNEPIPTKSVRTIPGLLDCSVCLSIWVAVVFVITPLGWLTYASAAAGLSMLIMGFSGWRYE